MLRIESSGRKSGKAYRGVIWKDLKRYRTKWYHSEEKALKEGVELLKEAGSQEASNQAFNEGSFSLFLDYWVENHCKGKKESWISQKRNIELYIKPQMGNKKIKEITPFVLQLFFDWLKNQPVKRDIDVEKIRLLYSKGSSLSYISRITGNDRSTIKKYLERDVETLANSTVNRIRSLLHKIFEDVRKIYRLVVTNPVSAIKVLHEPKEVIKFWTETEVNRFIKVNSESPFIYLYLFCLNTGVRVGELLGLTFKGVDFETGKIRIYQQWKRKEKRFSVPKSKKGRVIGMNGVVEEILRRYQVRNKGKPSDLVFSDTKGNPINYDTMHGDFLKCCKNASVENVGIHGLRHNFATHYIMNKGSWEKLQRLLGHSDYKTTLRYVHLVEDYLKKDPDVVEFGMPLDESNVVRI